ncbi:MAG: hypothetical protein KM310_08010 [Clostridiales bacterium]|nr:hypothetical protein [Clostridiales bacterium]
MPQKLLSLFLLLGFVLLPGGRLWAQAAQGPTVVQETLVITREGGTWRFFDTLTLFLPEGEALNSLTVALPKGARDIAIQDLTRSETLSFEILSRLSRGGNLLLAIPLGPSPKEERQLAITWKEESARILWEKDVLYPTVNLFILIPEKGVALRAKGVFGSGKETLSQTSFRVYSSQQLLPGTLVRLDLSPGRPFSPWWLLLPILGILALLLWRFRRPSPPR